MNLEIEICNGVLFNLLGLTVCKYNSPNVLTNLKNCVTQFYESKDAQIRQCWDI